MTPSTPRDRYVGTALVAGLSFQLELDRSRAIEDAQRERCLTPNGHAFFSHALLCYMAGQRETGDELVTKASSFLRLAQSIGERQRYDYVRRYCEGMRSAELSFLDWLATGELNGALLEDARANF